MFVAGDKLSQINKLWFSTSFINNALSSKLFIHYFIIWNFYKIIVLESIYYLQNDIIQLQYQAKLITFKWK